MFVTVCDHVCEREKKREGERESVNELEEGKTVILPVDIYKKCSVQCTVYGVQCTV